MKKKLKIPKFRSEAQERAFWAKVNLVDYFKPTDFKRNFWTLSGILKSKVKLTDVQLKNARKAFEVKWPRSVGLLNAWDITHGVMSREQGNKMMKHIARSRRKNVQAISVTSEAFKD